MTTRVAIISANLGSYDPPNTWPELEVPRGVELTCLRLTDANVPPRTKAMTSRLQCGIPKWFGMDFAPDADVIVWIDASCAPTPIAVSWFLERLGEAAVFRHPERRTIRDEYEFMVTRMARPGETYLTSRYAGEDLRGQFEMIEARGLAGLPLYASTAFAYRTTARMRQALAEVFLWKARYLLHDQLAFPFALHTHGCGIHVADDNYMKCDALTFTRKRRSA